MSIYKSLGLAVLAAFVLSGCESNKQAPAASEPMAPAPTVTTGTPESAVPVPVVENRPNEGTDLNQVQGYLNQTIIYFDYDSPEVRTADLSIVEAHAKYLTDNPGVAVLLEGHADERGSNEYNVALGEQRALAVANIMQLLGVQNGQLRTVSYGEERPQDTGENEASWERNRRVELKYQQ
ncbi:MAG: peptidoglycan-associated lipoprotein Pal [Chromatiales bacterium]|nr:peptidoglycan-associated lipoprotein Pal [Chromatiales bacterium]